MLKRFSALAFLALIALTLVGCGGLQPCNGVASAGPCSVGRHHDNSA